MSRPQVSIRPGARADKRAIAAFTQNTFHWGDYVPDAWDHWVVSQRGELYVAELDGQIAGTAHVRYLGNREAWLEGVRVHPALRQRGVASSLVQEAHRRARRRRCTVIRLETGVRNVPARRAFVRCGYRRVAEYATWKADMLPGQGNGVRLATRADWKTCWVLWERSRLKQRARSVVPANYGWRWWTWTPARLRQAIADKQIWLNQEKPPHAWMMYRAEDSLDLTMLVGSTQAVLGLMNTARALAAQTGKEQVYWLAPVGVEASSWAVRGGFVPDDQGLLIYECLLAPGDKSRC